MSKCKGCGVDTEFACCSFCGGQNAKTTLCREHCYFIVSKTGIEAAACGICHSKKLKTGLWTLQSK